MGGAQSKTGGKTSCHIQAQRGEAQGAIGDNTIQWVLVKQAFYFLFQTAFQITNSAQVADQLHLSKK